MSTRFWQSAKLLNHAIGTSLVQAHHNQNLENIILSSTHVLFLGCMKTTLNDKDFGGKIKKNYPIYKKSIDEAFFNSKVLSQKVQGIVLKIKKI